MFLFWNVSVSYLELMFIYLILYTFLMDKAFIMKRFLRKLINLNIWGGRHTELTNLKKAIPKHLRGEKITQEAIKELVAMEFITTKQSTGEMHISLNSKKQQEIYDFVKDEE